MAAISDCSGEATLYRRTLRLMGNRFEISVVASDEQWANDRIDEAVREISRIEALLTTYQDSSQTQLINQNAGIQPVRVDQEVFDLIQRSLRLSELTQGAFDITYGSIDTRLWNFDTTMTTLPDLATARQMIRLINYRNVIVDTRRQTVFLREKGMRIGFGGIGKGYAADRAKAILRRNGVEHGVVNAAGDLTAWGRQPNGQPWTIGIADPNTAQQPGLARTFSYLTISDRAVATSGSYEKYVMIDGKRYAHTIDPKTGYPATGIKSATLIAPSAELADALATPVVVMGVRVGLHLLNQLPQVAAIVIDDQDRLFTTTNINIKP